jgi:zinc protease
MNTITKTMLLCGLLAVSTAADPLPKGFGISQPAQPGGRLDIYKGGSIRAERSSPVRREVLRNGLRVLVNEAPQEDMVALEVLIQVGAMEETTPVEGVSQIIQELITQRVSNGPNGADRIEDSAAQFSVTPEMDYVRVSLVSTRQDFPALLTAVGDALKKRPVTAAEFEDVRAKLQRNLDQPQGALGQLYDIFRQTFYRYHPYRRSARVTQFILDRLKPKQVEDFLDQNYVANRIVVSISGKVDRNEAVEWVKKDFGQLPQRQLDKVEVSWEPKSIEKEVYLSGGGDVGWLFVGYPAPAAPSRDYATMRIINSILGEGLSSRLFTEIREKRSLCYELGSMYPVLKGPSHFLTYTVTKPDQVWPARKQLLVEIERLKKEGITASELEEAKRKVIGGYLNERETNQGRAFQAALVEMLGLGYEFDSQFMRLLDSVTTADIQNVAKRYLDNATLIVARPRGIYWDL